jgi:hypothetical protein
VSQGASLADELTATLRAARNPDGGWPYYKGKTSRLEPTCAALLALGLELTPLTTWPRRNGLFVDAADQVNVGFNGLAGIVMANRGLPAEGELADALANARGVPLPPSKINRQDNSIQAWAWTEDTFSWVEPTAWCLLALKLLTRASRSPRVLRRIDEGERLLADRVCREGGWNHGNSNMLGTELPPYIPATALALLALQDRASTQYVQRGVTYLEAHQQQETGAFALSLANIALVIYNRSRDAAQASLTNDWRQARFLNNLHTTALALYAATADHHGCRAFRV